MPSKTNHDLESQSLATEDTPLTSSTFSNENGTLDQRKEKEEEEQQQQNENDAVVPGSKNMIVGYLLLASTVIGLSSLAPTYDSLHGVNERIKLYWRLSGGAMFLAPWAWYNSRQNRLKREANPERYQDTPLTRKDWFWTSVGIVGFTGCLLLFVSSLRFTSVANAVILMNSQALVLLVYRIVFLRKPVGLVESIGAIVASLGVVFCAKDPRINHAVVHPHAVPNAYNTHPVLMGYVGDAMALCAAVGGVIFIVNTRSVRDRIDAVVFTFWNAFSGSFLVLLFLLATGQEFTVGTNPDTGLFGWMNWRFDRLFPEFVLVFICTMVGTLGFYRAMEYFDNLVMATSCLAQPVVAIFLAYFVGVGNLPGWLGWTGNVMVAAGTYAVIYTSDSRRRHGID